MIFDHVLYEILHVTWRFEAFCKVLNDNIVHMEGLTEKLNGYTDLVNIRDEMVGTLAQALYLLRLK
jgi:hypothetical protein